MKRNLQVLFAFLLITVSVAANNIKLIKNTYGDPTAEEIIAKYVKAIGGKDKLSNIKDLSINMTGNIMGSDITKVQNQKMPDKFKVVLTAQGMEMVNITMDGKKASTSMMGNTKVLEGKDLDDLKSQNLVFPELTYEKNKTKLVLLGKETLNGKETYKVEIQFTDKIKITEFFEIATGLKIRQITQNPMAGGEAVIDFSDYREVSGIKFPYVFSTTMPMGELKMEVKSIEVNKGLSDDIFKID